MPDTSSEDLAQLSTIELARRALDEARQLARAEAELAKQDLRAEVRDALHAARDLAIAYACAVLVLASLVTALAVGAEHAAIAVAAACAFLVVGAILGALGYKAAPKHALGPTRRRLSDDVHQLKQHVA
jgi:Flp pilus assembly protein TadB